MFYVKKEVNKVKKNKIRCRKNDLESYAKLHRLTHFNVK